MSEKFHTTDQPCPCQSNLDYARCCKPYHAGEHAPTALALMQSRYSAYALAEVDYLLKTTHRENLQYQKNTRAWRDEVLAYCRSTQFLGLVILNSAPGETTSTVTFQATLSQNGRLLTLSEKSVFVKTGPRWLYHSGETTIS